MSLTSSLSSTGSIYLANGKGGRIVRLSDISLIQAQGNYSLVQLVKGQPILVRRSLKVWADMLPPEEFVRVHRTVMVNLHRFKSWRLKGAKFALLEIEGCLKPVSVSRRRWMEIRSLITGRFESVAERKIG